MIDLNALGREQNVLKLVDESRSSSATANDSELQFTADANSWYDLEFYLIVTGLLH